MAYRLDRIAPFTLILAAGCEPAPPPPVTPAPTATVSASAVPTEAPTAAPTAPAPKRVPEAEMWSALCEGEHAYPMEVVDSREFVNVTLAGPTKTATLRFHVDSGGNTPGLVVSKSAVEPLGFTSADSLPKALKIGDKEVQVPDGASWVVLDGKRDTFRKDFSVGQIGAGFLSRFVVCIDPQKGMLGLTPKGTVEITDDKSSITFIPMFGGPKKAVYPFVHMLIKDGAGEFTGGYGVLLDTGATNTMLDLSKVEFQAKKVSSRPQARGTAGDADMIGGQWPEWMVRVEKVQIGTPGAYAKQKNIVQHPYVDVGTAVLSDRPSGTWDQMFGSVQVTMGSHGAIANDVLLRYRIIIDYPNERLWLSPSARPAGASASMTRVGVSLAFRDDGCPVIKQISTTNNKATLAALKIDDVLLEIDGTNACELYHHEISTRLAGKAGDKKKLRIERGATMQTVSVIVADLLTAP